MKSSLNMFIKANSHLRFVNFGGMSVLRVKTYFKEFQTYISLTFSENPEVSHFFFVFNALFSLFWSKYWNFRNWRHRIKFLLSPVQYPTITSILKPDFSQEKKLTKKILNEKHLKINKKNFNKKNRKKFSTKKVVRYLAWGLMPVTSWTLRTGLDSLAGLLDQQYHVFARCPWCLQYISFIFLGFQPTLGLT